MTGREYHYGDDDVFCTAQDDLRAFLLVLRRALLMIVRWIEKKYDLD